MTAKNKTDFTRSLTKLEKADWGEPTYDSYVVRTVHALRRKPLTDLTNEELRLAISQEVGVPFILDLAFERLRANPLMSGDFHMSDILALLVRASPSIWHERPSLQAELSTLVEQATEQSHEHDFDGELFRKNLRRPEDGEVLH